MADHRYPASMRLMHWIMALLILSLLFVGFSMTHWWSNTPYTQDLYFYHKSFGVIVLLLLIIRVGLRYHAHQHLPALATTLPLWERTLARIVHIGLYIAMAIMVVSGYLTSSFYTKTPGVPFFFGYLPQITPKDDAIERVCGQVHEIAAYGLILLLTLHIAGAIKHRYFDKAEHDSLKKMWF